MSEKRILITTIIDNGLRSIRNFGWLLLALVAAAYFIWKVVETWNLNSSPTSTPFLATDDLVAMSLIVGVFVLRALEALGGINNRITESHGSH